MRKAGLLLASVVFLAFAAPVCAQTQRGTTGRQTIQFQPYKQPSFFIGGHVQIQGTAQNGLRTP